MISGINYEQRRSVDQVLIIHEEPLRLSIADIDQRKVGSVRVNVFCLLKMGHPRPLFHLFSSFRTKSTICTTNKCENMSIQYMGFEPTTFGT